MENMTRNVMSVSKIPMNRGVKEEGEEKNFNESKMEKVGKE